MGLPIAVEIVRILSDTRACTIDIATIEPLRIVDVVSLQEANAVCIIRNANLSATNGHMGPAAHVSVLTTAIDRGEDGGTFQLLPVSLVISHGGKLCGSNAIAYVIS